MNKEYSCDCHGSKCDCEVMHADVISYVRENMPNKNNLEAMAKLFKAFGDGTRIKLLEALECHEMCVCDMAVTFNMTKSAVSHQLKVLRDNNIVKFEKKGKHVYYSLADDHVKEILDVVMEHINE